MNINLIPRQRHDRRRGRERLRVWAITNAVVAAIFLGGLTYTHVLRSSATAVLRQEIKAAQAAADRDDDVRRQLSEQLADASRDLTANLEVGYQPDWSILLALVGELTGKDVVLRRFDLRSDLTIDEHGQARTSRTIELTGLGRTQSAVSKLPIRLQEIPLFANVALHESRQEQFLSHAAVAFHLAFEIDPDPESTP